MHQLISKKIIIYLLLFFFLGTVNNYSIVSFSLPKIKNVEIYGIDLNESAKIRNIIEKSNINSIFSINHPNLKKNIDSINTIEKFEIFKNYPSTLKVKIKKTKFVAFTKKDGIDYFIGSNGKLIETNGSILKLPYVFGDLDVEEFIRFKDKIDKSNFDFNQISKLYFYKSKRWDIETIKGNIIKLPMENIETSLDLFIRLSKENKFKDSPIVDFRQKDQIILNEK
ncbi:FtsQ-type POTRA domain-containing protein [Candidatus Pelagibacter sp.]|nr:FtsQ-type POTRA domain-containing protein [Candidatus Pelagibacter sp.]